jgi:hypothetical protein
MFVCLNLYEFAEVYELWSCKCPVCMRPRAPLEVVHANRKQVVPLRREV